MGFGPGMLEWCVPGRAMAYRMVAQLFQNADVSSAYVSNEVPVVVWKELFRLHFGPGAVLRR